MCKNKFYNTLFEKFKELAISNNLLDDYIEITGNILTPKEAIGEPSKPDFPILKGKEKLIQADFRGHKGQAFTDMPNNFSAKLKDIIYMPLDTNFDTAVYIATLNAVCNYLDLCDHTIHCKDGEPEVCADELVDFIKNKYSNPNIALIGYQPAMLSKLGKNLNVRIVDLDPDNIGKIKYNVLVEDGYSKTNDLLNWCDLIVATGSTIANKSLTDFIVDKPVLFFGTTLAGAAAIMNLPRFCPCSK